MKKIITFTTCFCLVVLSGSCDKPKQGNDDLAFQNKIISGSYSCTNVVFFGDPVDLNNDGISNTYLLNEFKPVDSGNSNTGTFDAVNDILKIKPLKSVGKEQYFSVRLPLQMIDRDKERGEYLYLPGIDADFSIKFGYGMTPSGELTIKYFPVEKMQGSSPTYDYNVDYQNTDMDRIISFGQGYLVFDVSGCYYDYKTKSLVKGKTRFTFRKTNGLE